MFRAKNGVYPLLSRMAVCLALAFSAIGTGCAGPTGLRSVGTDRPSLLGFWDRSQPPPPDPAGDYYARYMRTARDRADGMAKQSADSSGPAGDAGETERVALRDDLDATGTPSGSSPSRTAKTAASSAPVRDDGLRVTLGPPEPLPALSHPAPQRARIPRGLDMSPVPAKRDRPSPEAVAEPKSTADSAPRLARRNEDDVEDRRRPDEPVAKPAPKRPAKPATQAREAQAILAQSRNKLESLTTYQVKISRTERVNKRLLPEEQIVLSIRRDPKAVRLEWADGPNQGREVIYSTAVNKGSLFVHMPKSPIPLPTMKIAVDSAMVMQNSRHSIAEAGFDTIIDNLQKAQDGGRKPDLGRLTYRGIEKPPDSIGPATSSPDVHDPEKPGPSFSMCVLCFHAWRSRRIRRANWTRSTSITKFARIRRTWQRPARSSRISVGVSPRACSTLRTGGGLDSPNNRQSATR